MNKKELLKNIDQASQLANKRQYEKANTLFKKLLDEPLEDAEVLHRFGSLCNQFGEETLAIGAFGKIVEQHPENASYIANLGNALLMNGSYIDAQEQLAKSLKLNKDNWQALLDMGIIYITQEDYVEALKYLRQAESLKPSQPVILANLAIALMKTGDHNSAIIYGEKAISSNPDNANVYDSIGYALVQLGRLREAEKYFTKSIKRNPLFGESYYNLCNAKKFNTSDKKFIQKTEDLLEQSMPAQSRYYFHFALGNMYDDCKDWDKAFQHYKQGNILAKSRFQGAHLPKCFFQTQQKVFTSKLLSSHLQGSSPSELPVFIVGMPRSGTTLMEQIIASHLSADGAGELGHIHRMVTTISQFESTKQSVDEFSTALSPESLQQLSENYLAELQNDREEALRVTDKMPENYLHLGIIHTLFPNAKVIHMIRNPLDTCLSCYFQAFTHVDWSYQVKLITERYKMYQKTIAYWKSVLPAGTILDVEYQDLIENSEPAARKVLKYIGLDWDPACLDFHEKESTVQTASVWQVRQPIYKSSVNRWERYGVHIAPFAEELADFLSDEDLNSLKEQGINVKKKSWLAKVFLH